MIKYKMYLFTRSYKAISWLCRLRVVNFDGKIDVELKRAKKFGLELLSGLGSSLSF